MKWKIDPSMAIWGISFGVVATLTGMFVLAALHGGFLAEGFFLIVLGWVLFLVTVAKITSRLRSARGKRGEEK